MTNLPELDPLELNTIDLSTNDMVIRLGTLADLIDAHHGYGDDLPEEVFGSARFRALATELHQTAQEAVNKDTAKVAKKHEKHKEAAVAIAVFGQFAVMRSIHKKDPSYLDNLGFVRKVRRTGKKTACAPHLTSPDPFSVKHGPESRSLVFKIGALKWASHYDVYACLGDPNDEGSWFLAATFFNTRNTQIDGLEPGKVCMFRVRGVGAAGFGPWSSIIKIMVV